MNLQDFDYHLPPENIAQIPLKNREDSKLLTLNKETGKIDHHIFRELPSLLTSNDVLVFNNSKVIPARLYTQEGWEVFLAKKLQENRYECMVKPGKKFKKGKIIIFGDDFTGEVIDIDDNSGLRIIEFQTNNLEKALHTYGNVPLPPYIKEKLRNPDRYQTIYSKKKGSVAAPTAGLHFTKEVLQELEQKGVKMEYITLHVGLGTFQPVKTENIKDHTMHSEYFELEKETVKRLNAYKKKGKRIISVGTTATRVLEHCSHKNKNNDYLLKEEIGETNIFIFPGYHYKFIDALITNFHLPKSTLLMLVSALSKREDILNAYKTAVNKGYRFYSFGDCMFIY